MAFRTWGRSLLAALGVGALVGTGQLGFAYGLGIVRFGRTFDAGTHEQWTAQLAWITWFAIIAAITGAVAADRLARRHGASAAIGSRVTFAVGAGVGAAAVAPLVMQPARAAHVPSLNPVLVTGLTAGLGAVVGIFAALAVLSDRTAGWNVAAVTGGVWVLALISVTPSLGPADPLPAVRLGVLDPASLSAQTTQRLGIVAMPALALVAGSIIGALARWRGHPMRAVASSGAVGPGLLALAYLLAGPGTPGEKYQAAPYWGALIAVGAGGLGSVLAAVVRRPVAATEQSDPAGAVESTDVPRPLPGRRDTSGPDVADQDATHNEGRAETAADDAEIRASPADTRAGRTDPDAGRGARGAAPRGNVPGATAARNAETVQPKASPGRNARGRPDPPVPARDEDYVGWVSGLSAPDGRELDRDGAARRSLRSGRHQAD